MMASDQSLCNLIIYSETSLSMKFVLLDSLNNLFSYLDQPYEGYNT